MTLIEPYRIIYRDFGCWDARACVVENEDGETVVVLNSRYTREQLMDALRHERRHILLGHLRDPRPVQELEREASPHNSNACAAANSHNSSGVARW